MCVYVHIYIESVCERERENLKDVSYLHRRFETDRSGGEACDGDARRVSEGGHRQRNARLIMNFFVYIHTNVYLYICVFVYIYMYLYILN